MWVKVWKLAIDYYVFHSLVVVAVFIIIIRPERIKRFFEQIRKFLGKYKKIKAGPAGIELELKDEKNHAKDIEQDESIKIILEELEQINLRLDKHYKYIKEAAVMAANSNVWSDTGVPFVEVIRAGLLNANLGANGNLRPRMVEVIKGFGKEGISVYRSLLNEFIKNNEGKLSSYFYETTAWIEKELSKKAEEV